MNFRKSHLLLVGTYHPPCQNDQYYFKSIGKGLNIYSANYDKYILAGDFNAEDKEAVFRQFLELYGLKNIVHECTCFKSLNNPSCIDLFLTNSYRSFHNTNVISTGLSDFHKMVVTVMKTTLPKAKPKQLLYRDYKKFNEKHFNDDLMQHLSARTNFSKFQDTFLCVLDSHAPMKKKCIRANEAPYMTKHLRKAIIPYVKVID